jgi:hypothetical protein
VMRLRERAAHCPVEAAASLKKFYASRTPNPHGSTFGAAFFLV